MALLYIFTSMYLLGYAYQCLVLKDQARQHHLTLIKIENLKLDVNNIRLDIIKLEGERALSTFKKVDDLITENHIQIKKDLSELKNCLHEIDA